MQNLKKNKAYLTLIALFCAAILAVPIYWLATPRKDFSAMEKRYLAAFPSLADADITDWTFDDDIETYLADQLPLRDFLVGVDAYAMKETGRQVASSIWVDREGYLVEKPVEENAQQMEKHMAILNAFALANDTVATLIIPPSTGYVRQEQLPKAQRIYKDGELFAEMRGMDLPGIEFLDLSGVLTGGMFYRTDHHWNAAGAYEAYLQYAKHRGYSPFAPQDFTITRHAGFYGSTYARSALWLTEADTLELWDLGQEVEVAFSDDGQVHSSLFFPAHLSAHDQYPVYLDGDHPLATVRNLDTKSDKRLLVIKDSFADSLVPLLVGHYREIVLVDLRYYHDAVSELIQEKPFDEILIVYSLEHIISETEIGWLK